MVHQESAQTFKKKPEAEKVKALKAKKVEEDGGRSPASKKERRKMRSRHVNSISQNLDAGGASHVPGRTICETTIVVVGHAALQTTWHPHALARKLRRNLHAQRPNNSESRGRIQDLRRKKKRSQRKNL